MPSSADRSETSFRLLYTATTSVTTAPASLSAPTTALSVPPVLTTSSTMATLVPGETPLMYMGDLE